MKHLFMIIFLSITAIQISGQDTLVLTNTKTMVVHIKTIEDDMIYYTLSGQKNDPVLSIDISQIDKILYAEGHELDITENEMNDVYEDPGITKNNQYIYPQKISSAKSAFRMKLGLGLMIGASSSTLQYKSNNELIDLYNTYRFSPAGGIFLEWEITRFLSLRSSFYYLDKGDRSEGEEYLSNWTRIIDDNNWLTANGNGYIDKHLSYIECSILPLFGYTKKDNSTQYQIGAGIYLAYGISGNEKTDLFVDYFLNGDFDENKLLLEDNEVVFVSDQSEVGNQPGTLYYNQIDYGISLYLGVKPRPLHLGISLSYGLANILPSPLEDLPITNKAIDTATNNSIKAIFGYYF